MFLLFIDNFSTFCEEKNTGIILESLLDGHGGMDLQTVEFGGTVPKLDYLHSNPQMD